MHQRWRITYRSRLLIVHWIDLNLRKNTIIARPRLRCFGSVTKHQYIVFCSSVRVLEAVLRLKLVGLYFNSIMESYRYQLAIFCTV